MITIIQFFPIFQVFSWGSNKYGQVETILTVKRSCCFCHFFECQDYFQLVNLLFSARCWRQEETKQTCLVVRDQQQTYQLCGLRSLPYTSYHDRLPAIHMGLGHTRPTWFKCGGEPSVTSTCGLVERSSRHSSGRWIRSFGRTDKQSMYLNYQIYIMFFRNMQLTINMQLYNEFFLLICKYLFLGFCIYIWRW